MAEKAKSIIEFALQAVVLGWATFPLAPKTKVPLSGSHGHKDATHDESVVRGWWEGIPEANIGIATGTASGFFVIDIDPRNGGHESLANLEAEHGPLPTTVTVETGGGGRHLYFKIPDGIVSSGIIAPGLDLKGEGGAVVGAGSVHPSGRRYDYAAGCNPTEVAIAAAPEWLWQLIETRQVGGRRVDDLDDVGPIVEGSRNVALASLAGAMRRRAMTRTEIVAALHVVNTERCAPPLPDTEVERIADSMSRYVPGDPATYPELNVGNRQLRELTAEAIAILEATNYPPVLFTRGAQLVRLLEDEDGRPHVSRVGKDELRSRLVSVASCVRYTVEGRLLHVSPPDELLANTLASGRWPFPPLTSVVQQPFLRPDGTVIIESGYDDQTRTVFAPPRGFTMPAVLENPSGEEVAKAIALLHDLLVDFPFEDDASRANALGLLLTLVVRPAISGRTPVFLMDKPQAGTGASLLAEIAGWLATNRPPAMAPAPSREEEWTKTLLALSLQGLPVIVFDNLERRLQSASLASAVTSGFIFGRILGESTIVTSPFRSLLVVTGNNIRLGGDMARRSVWIRMDAQQARPWERKTFTHADLPGWVEAHHGELIGSLLTIARAWHVAGRPPGAVRLGGFDEWASTIGGMLQIAGENAFLANLGSLYDRVDDEAPQWEAWLRALSLEFGTSAFKTAEVVGTIEADPTLGEALPDELDPAERSFNKRLGRALLKRLGVRYGADGIYLASVDGPSKVRRWRIERAVSGVPEVFEQALADPEEPLAAAAEPHKAANRGTEASSEALSRGRRGSVEPAPDDDDGGDHDAGQRAPKAVTPKRHIRVAPKPPIPEPPKVDDSGLLNFLNSLDSESGASDVEDESETRGEP